MAYIEVNHITKDYGRHRGNFDISLSVEKGEVFGLVGVNGAGKTTLIRQMMGFIKPQKGHIMIDGLDSWTNADQAKKKIGYIPGEIAFPDAPTGEVFLRRQAELLKMKDMKDAQDIISLFQLDATARLKRMSKGMKQKTAIVEAFMNHPDILLLDEPTTGLDPLMRKDFIELLNAEKKKGTTIFMSSHMFEEVEQTCDRVAFIKDGQIIDIIDMNKIRHNENKTYKIEFMNHKHYQNFINNEDFNYVQLRDTQNQVIVSIHDDSINEFLKALKKYQLKFMTEIKYSLENYFKTLYKEEQHV